MTRTRIARIATTGILTCALVAGGAAASFAADTPQPTASASASTGSHPHRCARAQHTDKRVQRVLDRIQADASHRGSIAWLQDRITDAQKAGKTQVAADLTTRLNRREARVPKLQAAEKRLETVIAQRCSAPTDAPTPAPTS